MFSSETCALDIAGAEYVRDVEPGEIIRVKDGIIKSKSILKLCLSATSYVQWNIFTSLDLIVI